MVLGYVAFGLWFLRADAWLARDGASAAQPATRSANLHMASLASVPNVVEKRGVWADKETSPRHPDPPPPVVVLIPLDDPPSGH